MHRIVAVVQPCSNFSDDIQLYDGPEKTIEMNPQKCNVQSSYFIMSFVISPQAHNITVNLSSVLLEAKVITKPYTSFHFYHNHPGTIFSSLLFIESRQMSNRLTLHVDAFEGYTSPNCIYGGLALQTISDDKTDVHTVDHGPFCDTQRARYLLGEFKTLALSKSHMFLYLYAYASHFMLDVYIQIILDRRCEGVLNICEACIFALKTHNTKIINGERFQIFCRKRDLFSSSYGITLERKVWANKYLFA